MVFIVDDFRYEKSILFGYQKGEDVIGSKNDREENKIIM